MTRLLNRILLVPGRGRPGVAGGGGSSSGVDALIQDVIDGGADYVVIELYSGIRPLTETTGVSTMMGWNAGSNGVSFPALNYRVGNADYYTAGVPSVPLVGSTVPHPTSGVQYGAWRFSINPAGVVTCTPAPGNDGSTGGFWNKTLVMAGLPQVPTGAADLGFLLVQTETTDFIPGTTLLNNPAFKVLQFPSTLVATYTLVPPVAPSSGLIDNTHVSIHVVGGEVYVPQRPTWALCRYPSNVKRINLWVGDASSGADILIDNLDAATSQVWSPISAQAAAE